MGKSEDKLLFFKPRSKAWVKRAPEFSKGTMVTFVERQDGGRSWCSPKWLLVVMGMENVEIMDARWKCSVRSKVARMIKMIRKVRNPAMASTTDSSDYGS